MPLRLSILFAFFAFSFAWADCDDEDDFEIFANGESLGCDEEVSIEITYGDPLTFSVSPATGTYSWISSNTKITTGYSYTPEFLVSENPSPDEDVIETYKVRRADGLTKTIKVTIIGRNTYYIYFDTDEADNITDEDGNIITEIEPQEVLKGDLATEPKVTLTKAGYIFGGWDFDFSTPIVEDNIIKAIWNIGIYIVSFDTEGGTPSIPFQKIKENNLAKEPKETLTKEGYTFEGWNFDFSTPIVEDTTVKAIWKISDLFVENTIVFKDDGFTLDSIFSSKQRQYFVFSPSLCEIKDTIEIQTTKYSDMVLKRDGSEQPTDENGLHYKITFIFQHKFGLDTVPGLDTLIYEWISKKDASHIEFDTILIETPIPFDAIVRKKWNSVLFVNNNPKTNGGYEFTNFEWFKNNNEAGNLQFYSIASDYADDTYKVVMQTTKRTRISSCEGNIKAKTTTDEQPTNPKLTKQVLGIKEKSLNKNSKIYNLNGKLTKETPAGVYIVKEE